MCVCACAYNHVSLSCSYCHEAPDGVEPETEFIFDLEIPQSFIPIPLDGEVSEYYLWTMDKVTILFVCSYSNYSSYPHTILCMAT